MSEMSNQYRSISAWTNDATPYVSGAIGSEGRIRVSLDMQVELTGRVPEWVVTAWTNWFMRALHMDCVTFVRDMASVELELRYPLVTDGDAIATPKEGPE